MFFRSRRDGRPDRFLGVKHSLFWLGAGFGLIGMATGAGWMVWLAIAALGLGVLLGAWGRREAGQADVGEGEGGEGESEDHDIGGGDSRPPEVA